VVVDSVVAVQAPIVGDDDEGIDVEQGDRGAVHPLVAGLTSAVDAIVAAVRTLSDEVPVDVLSGSGEPGGLVGSEATQVLLGLLSQESRLQAAAARLSTSADDDGLWATDGSRSFAHWLAGRTGTTFSHARDLVATGRALRDHLPATARAALDGEVGADHVAALVRLAPTTDTRRAALATPAEECGEEFLLEHAREMPAAAFRRLVTRWAAAADPEADERGYRRACDREFLAVSPTIGGFHLAGFLTVEHGAVVTAALDAVTTAPPAGDKRSAQQRRAQALADVARLVVDHGLAGTGSAVRPHLSVVVDFDTLRRAVGDGDGERDDARHGGEHGSSVGRQHVDDAGSRGHATDGTASGRLFRLAPVADVERFAVAEILGAGPIPPSVLARLACDGELSRIVFGPDSQVINAGRAERTYSGGRRKAVIARDGTCRYPGCTAPPALGEIHHVDEWVRDHGDTDANLGILLCWHHHDLIHRRHISIRRSPTGGWVFLTRHGTPVTRTV